MAENTPAEKMAPNNPFAGLPPVSSQVTTTPTAPQGHATAAPQSAVPAQLGPPGSVQMASDNRPYTEFRLPPESLGDEWAAAGFDDDCLRFGLTQIVVDQQIRSGRLMGAKMDVGTAVIEQQLMCVYTIGNHKVSRNRDFKRKWLDAIGPGGRQHVEFCWNKINTRPETESEQVYEMGERKRG